MTSKLEVFLWFICSGAFILLAEEILRSLS